MRVPITERNCPRHAFRPIRETLPLMLTKSFELRGLSTESDQRGLVALESTALLVTGYPAREPSAAGTFACREGIAAQVYL
jgi:hypothetical protein